MKALRDAVQRIPDASDKAALSYAQLCQPRADELERGSEINAATWRARLSAAGIAKRFEHADFDGFHTEVAQQRHVLHVCRTYAEHFAEAYRTGTSLLLCGGVGTGKTHLASAVCRAVVRAGATARMTTVLRALRTIRESYRRDATISETQAVQSFIKPELLVLDEVGVQRGTGDELLQIFEILDGRYNAVRPTVLVSNLAFPELKKYLGERVIDRLREGGGKLLSCDWASFRGKAE